MKFQFWLVDFELPLPVGASKYCEAVEFWTKTKMKIYISHCFVVGFFFPQERQGTSRTVLKGLLQTLERLGWHFTWVCGPMMAGEC